MHDNVLAQLLLQGNKKQCVITIKLYLQNYTYKIIPAKLYFCKSFSTDELDVI